MTVVLWGIAKVIGLVLLVLLLLIVAALLIVLFVPVRYRAEISADGAVRGQVRATWLLHLVSFRLLYDRELTLSLRVLAFRLMGGEEKRKRKRKRRQRRESPGGRERPAEREEKAAKESPVKESERLSEKSPPGSVAEPEPAPPKPPPPEPESASESRRAPAAHGTKTEETDGETKAKGIAGKIWLMLWKLGKRIAGIFRAVRAFPARLRRLKARILAAFRRLRGRIKELKNKKDRIWEFLSKEENRKTLLLIKRQVFAVIRHILPRKVKGEFRFGFDDPSVTGQVLMAVSPFYGCYARSLTLTPVFEEKVLVGNVSLKGRIRVATLLVIVIRLCMDRNFRRLARKWLR
ncbi:MAG: hypothetical protein LUE86_10470 [Clostridiales bacterium]|nr:hypothetical protein [Clostridiales bacterium]